MADGIIQVPADSTGKKIDTSELTVGVNTVERERIVIANDSGATSLAVVQNAAPGASDYGLTVRHAGTANVRPSDGTNPITGTFDVDSGAGTQYVEGVSLRLSASGGSVEAGTTTNPVNVAFVPSTSGGCSIYHVVAAASTNAANIKASAGQVYGWNIFNNAGYPVYVKFHNTAGTPTAGAGVVHAIGVQAGVGRDNSNTLGMAFATGIGISIVKDITDAGATAVALSDCVADIYYK